MITKNRYQYRQKPIRVATGMVVRTTGVAIAGAYLATRATVVHGRRIYKRVAPHARRIAGGTARASYAYSTVYGHHAATTVRRRALRAAARHRTAHRRRRLLRANPDLHAALVATGSMSTRSMRIARRAASLLDTDTSPPKSTTPKPAAPKVKPATTRPVTPGRASTNPTPPTRPAPNPSASTKTGGNTMSTPSVPAKMHSTNPAHHLMAGFRLAGETEPDNWVSWMQFLQGSAAAFRQGSESYTQLALTMDLKHRMDPRALVGLYTMGGALGQLSDLTVASAHTFWRLYSDRLENNGARGRAMTDETKFFGTQ